MKTNIENILLPKDSQIVDGSFQVQVGTLWLDSEDNQGTGEFSSLLTLQQLEDDYGISIIAVNRDVSIVGGRGQLGALEFTDFEIKINQNSQGAYTFKFPEAVPA
jgi:hypothetical protein